MFTYIKTKNNPFALLTKVFGCIIIYSSKSSSSSSGSTSNKNIITKASATLASPLSD